MVVLLAASGAVVADVVIFKDGFTLQGKIRRETTNFVDPASGLQMSVAKLNGFFMVDDEARRIYLSHRQVQDANEQDPKRDADLVRMTHPFVRDAIYKLPPGRYISATLWNDKWRRVLTLEIPNGRREIDQHLTMLTPYFARIDAVRYPWTAFYLTRELDAEAVRQTLYVHPDLKLNGGSGDAAKRFRVYRFLVQAGWYDKAAAELASIATELPDQKEKAESYRDDLKKLLTAQLVDRIEEAHRVGRYQWARTRLASLPEEGLDAGLLVRLRTLREAYETSNQNLALSRKLLGELPARVTDPDQQRLFKDAARAILAELNPDTVDRLQTFVGLAQQVGRATERERAADYTPEQLLAVALSGWLLGNNSAEAKVDTAIRLWQARQFFLEHQRTHNAIDRQQLVAAYQKSESIPFDELAQVIRLMPPPEPFDRSMLRTGSWAVGTLPLFPAPLYWALFSAQKALPARYELQADLPWAVRKGPTYSLQLPPEYHHGRSYPVLFALHDVGEPADALFKRWGALAAQHGYILVVPEWDRNQNQAYGYTPEEHRAVVEVLRDLRQRLQVDSDRVFVTGAGEGASMAFDVGMSHPDLFAGIAPVSGRLRFFAKSYWRNAQYLPFYVVDGDLSDNVKDIRQQFENWVSHGYPALYIQYKGRGMESFEGEVPNIFDWMVRKKRASAVPDLGRSGGGSASGDEFYSMRPTDNRFYWLRGEELHERHCNTAEKWSTRTGAAYLQAHISEGNQININARGFKRITAWFGQGMVDFTKPVKVYVNRGLVLQNRQLTPSLATLLEDFYVTGDRQRLYWAKLEFPL
jgi:hypothetical protein